MEHTLYDLIAQNRNLRFIDAPSGTEKTISAIDGSLSLESGRTLAFVYNDNRLAAVEVLLNFYKSDHAIALLGSELDNDFKEQLESRYMPYYIFDPSRAAIAGYTPVPASEDINLLRRNEAAPYPIHPRIKLLLSTSGSTGSPKFVKISDAGLVQNAHSILAYMPVQAADVVPLNVPLNFVYGLSIFTTNCIKAGSIVCTDRDPFRKEFWSDFDQYGFSTLGGVPYFYEMLYRIGFFRKDHPNLRYLTHTGGLMNAQLVAAICQYNEQYGKSFIIQYGQTEACGRMAYLPPADLATKGDSIGKPVQNGSFEIDPETGELIYCGPNIFGGYAQQPEDLAHYQQEEKLHTGDIARVDDDGYYYIAGRMKRIVKLFGLRLNLDEVELLLKNAFGGQTFVCLNGHDKFLVVMHASPDLMPAPIHTFIQHKLGISASAVRVSAMTEMPLTPNGKIDYPLLNARLKEGNLQAI